MRKKIFDVRIRLVDHRLGQMQLKLIGMALPFLDTLRDTRHVHQQIDRDVFFRPTQLQQVLLHRGHTDQLGEVLGNHLAGLGTKTAHHRTGIRPHQQKGEDQDGQRERNALAQIQLQHGRPCIQAHVSGPLP